MSLPEKVTEFPALPIPGAEHFIRIEDGEYTAKVIGCEAAHFRSQCRVRLWFEIVDPEIQGERRIPAIYAVQEVLYRDKRARIGTANPEFTVGWKSRIVRDMATLFPEDYTPNHIPMQMPLCQLMSGTILITTRTVKRDADGPRPESFHYSVVNRVVGWQSDI